VLSFSLFPCSIDELHQIALLFSPQVHHIASTIDSTHKHQPEDFQQVVHCDRNEQHFHNPQTKSFGCSDRKHHGLRRYQGHSLQPFILSNTHARDPLSFPLEPCEQRARPYWAQSAIPGSALTSRKTAISGTVRASGVVETRLIRRIEGLAE